MTNIFLSRPTWVSHEFEAGLSNFCTLLTTAGLVPRTLGVGADRPTRSPLDDVIALMDECQGAVILGFPQIVVTSGTCKNSAILAELKLPTEWNHIEAGLSYARGLPLLVIHHLGVSRGIFDRGAINSFIYEVDMSSPTWALDQAIAGAVKTWSERVVKNPARQALVGQNDGRRPLHDEEVAALKIMAENGLCDLGTLAQRMHLPENRATYYVDGLVRDGLAVLDGDPAVVAFLRITAEGRAVLFERGLL